MPTPLFLIAGGNRNVVIQAEQAQEIIDRFRADIASTEGAKLHALDLSCRSWTREAIDVLEPFLKEYGSTLTIVNLDDCIAGRMTDEGLEVMERLARAFSQSPGLIEIGLNDNAMGPRGLIRIEPMLQNISLQRLYLSNCGLSAESMEMLKTSVLANDGRIAKALRELVLDKNMMGIEGAQQVGEFLKHCKNMEYFSYAGCRPQPEGTKSICEGILGSTQDNPKPSYRHLNLDDCTIGESEDDAVGPLSQALKKCSQLSFLSMRSGDLEADGMTMIVDALLESGAHLTDLYLESNGDLSSDGAEQLARLFEANVTSIRHLNIEACELGDQGVCTALAPFQSPRNVLEELNLVQNEIEKDGADFLMRLPLDKLQTLMLEDNMDIPKKYLKIKYGNKVTFDDDDDDEEGGDEDADGAMDALCGALQGTSIS